MQRVRGNCKRNGEGKQEVDSRWTWNMLETVRSLYG